MTETALEQNYLAVLCLVQHSPGAPPRLQRWYGNGEGGVAGEQASGGERETNGGGWGWGCGVRGWDRGAGRGEGEAMKDEGRCV